MELHAVSGGIYAEVQRRLTFAYLQLLTEREPDFRREWLELAQAADCATPPHFGTGMVNFPRSWERAEWTPCSCGKHTLLWAHDSELPTEVDAFCLRWHLPFWARRTVYRAVQLPEDRQALAQGRMPCLRWSACYPSEPSCADLHEQLLQNLQDALHNLPHYNPFTPSRNTRTDYEREVFRFLTAQLKPLIDEYMRGVDARYRQWSAERNLPDWRRLGSLLAHKHTNRLALQVYLRVQKGHSWQQIANALKPITEDTITRAGARKATLEALQLLHIREISPQKV
ncbi:MAG: hypothetical protein WHS44_09880 [Fimbriimonadales bacterium]|nr:MAG: hypothetical protein KatS3mg018_0166 [Fimbriimonadales bacterium]